MRYLKELVSLRRDFHKYPETGWLEFETTVKIVNYLKELGLIIKYGKEIHGERLGLPSKETLKRHREEILTREIDFNIEKKEEILNGYTGCIGILDTKREGKTTVLRFDIDANEVEECKEFNHRPFREGFSSLNKGMMHACGHDGHISIGLMLAKQLVSIKDELCGKIIFIFQPAEEGVRGAKSIINSRILNGTDYFLSSHIGFMAKKGEVVCSTESFLATTKLDIYFYGKASHAGASPELGKNALLAGANCAINLHSLNQFSYGISRINVGTFIAGTGRNVVPDKAVLKIETRGENQRVNSELLKRVYEVVKGASIMYDLEYEIIEVGSAMAYDKVNEEFSDFIYKLLNRENLKLIKKEKFGASEDVTYMMKKVEDIGGKASYMVIGADRYDVHHGNRFDFSEESLEIGLECYFKIVEKLNSQFNVGGNI